MQSKYSVEQFVRGIQLWTHAETKPKQTIFAYAEIINLNNYVEFKKVLGLFSW